MRRSQRRSVRRLDLEICISLYSGNWDKLVMNSHDNPGELCVYSDNWPLHSNEYGCIGICLCTYPILLFVALWSQPRANHHAASPGAGGLAQGAIEVCSFLFW